MAALVAAILVSPKQHLYAIAPQQTTLAMQVSTTAQQRAIIALVLLRFWAMIDVWALYSVTPSGFDKQGAYLLAIIVSPLRG